MTRTVDRVFRIEEANGASRDRKRKTDRRLRQKLQAPEPGLKAVGSKAAFAVGKNCHLSRFAAVSFLGEAA